MSLCQQNRALFRQGERAGEAAPPERAGQVEIRDLHGCEKWNIIKYGITDYVFITVNSRKFSLFLCLYIQNGLNLRLLPVNYICCEDAMNAFISSSLGSSIMYFRTKMLGSNPAVAYFTIVSPFSVQSSFEAEAVSHFQFQWLVNKFTSNTIFNIKTKCARNRNFVHILFFSSFLSFSWTGGKRNGLPPSINLLFFIIKAGFSGKSRKRDEFPVS